MFSVLQFSPRRLLRCVRFGLGLAYGFKNGEYPGSRYKYALPARPLTYYGVQYGVLDYLVYDYSDFVSYYQTVQGVSCIIVPYRYEVRKFITNGYDRLLSQHKHIASHEPTCRCDSFGRRMHLVAFHLSSSFASIALASFKENGVKRAWVEVRVWSVMSHQQSQSDQIVPNLDLTLSFVICLLN